MTPGSGEEESSSAALTEAACDAVYDYVRRIPRGKVVTYGQVADAVRSVRLSARQVGAAMRFAPEGVPWQRVIGAGGRILTLKRSPEIGMLQTRLLEQEGVPFMDGEEARVEMRRAQWLPEPQMGGLWQE